MSELVLINVSGRDKPGLTSEITGIMGRYDVRILDIGQAVIHGISKPSRLPGFPPSRRVMV